MAVRVATGTTGHGSLCDACGVIIGVGIDVVDVARFGETLARTPNLVERLFTPAEQEPAARVAGRAVRGQGGARQGARGAGQPALARRRGDHRRRRSAVARGPRHGARRADLLGVRAPAPVAEPRRRHRQRRRRAGGLMHAGRPRGQRRPRRRARAMARLGEGVLMQRAAAGLAATTAHGASDGCTARGWSCSPAAATTAATRCTPAPRWLGAAPGSTRCCSTPDRAHAGGLAASAAAGGRIASDPSIADRRRPRARRLGRHRRDRRAPRTGRRAGRRTSADAPSSWRWTCPAASTPTPARWPVPRCAPT